MKRGKIYEKYIKRLLDLLLSAVVMLLFSWLYLIIGLLVRIFLGRPVIFSQERPGRNDPKTGKEKPFRLCYGGRLFYQASLSLKISPACKVRESSALYQPG